MNPSISSKCRALLSSALFMASIAPACAAGQQDQQTPPALADTVPLAAPAPAAAVRPAAPAITRIVLAAEELPVPGRAQPAYALQPRAAPVRQLERDAITLRAARAALLQNDASHRQQLAALR
ncbi:hypothetical protein [Massilia sp. Root351]|uniref:hypothetical protein n=1 Tax=Massilia sp. Root351 TaxID=1736522 RepID=UPI000B2006A3|nr:hypothetical protein [Massilia sp. Root351]